MNSYSKILKANILLIVASFIWGTSFVAQREGMSHIGPFAFSGFRFIFGCIFLAPFAFISYRKIRHISSEKALFMLWNCFLAGMLMFVGINLQQIGIVYTTAGKAGFITGLYAAIVPCLGLAIGQRPNIGLWVSLPLVLTGLYLLSINESYTFAKGDLWILSCAFVWAVHVLFLGWLSPKVDSFLLAFGQSFVCAVFSIIAAGFLENINISGFLGAKLSILYSGVMSVGVAFTLQVIAQKDSPPAHAAIILQLESLIAAISGWLILGELMSERAIFGAALMLIGVLIVQLWPQKKIN
ncbi:MAG: DMT family transporter [Desulfobacterales bacterium]|nr:DMT family transporter [Desulfobacterales bacterium]